MRDLSRDHRWLSINTATVRRQGDLLSIIDVCAVRDAELELSGYCHGGMFPGEKTRASEIRDDNRRTIDEASALGVGCIVLVVGGLPQFSRPGSTPSKDLASARAMVEAGLAEMMDYAWQARMPLAIEPLHPMYAADRACVNTTAHALDICDRLDPERSGSLGIALDVYHTWWDPAEHPTRYYRYGYS